MAMQMTGGCSMEVRSVLVLPPFELMLAIVRLLQTLGKPGFLACLIFL